MTTTYKNTMLVGAGEAGIELIHDLLQNAHLPWRIVCIIDDDPTKHGTSIHNIPVVGGRNCIIAATEQYSISDIVIAIPSAHVQAKKEIIELCQQTKCRIKTLPSFFQFIAKNASARLLRNIDLNDLLAREPSHIDLSQISALLRAKTVLVTGGGGSIGSELCRQIARNNVNKLIIVDIYENNAYDIQQEILTAQPDIALEVLIGSIRDFSRMEHIFATYKPDFVFHAAAHKHVPLMEQSPHEAIKNNVFGTYNLAVLADRHKVKKFVFISTDKAVNPTNIMGATKRLCEMIVQMFNERSSTEFMAVRFGNVLGSNGSVIPLFQKQIAAGGPVTVTHKDITRFFMTTGEAVALVLTAGANARGGEIFILDMGEPVKIFEMAKNLIRIHGYEPDRDIKIIFTQLRPGEKLYEEILLAEEGIQKTNNEKIYVAQPINFDSEQLEKQLENLKLCVGDPCSNMQNKLMEIVSTYKPNSATC